MATLKKKESGAARDTECDLERQQLAFCSSDHLFPNQDKKQNLQDDGDFA
jgi:hypothetical protein